MKIHLLSGFLGSGKTTAIQQACNVLLQQGERVAVITNDQGMHLVDGDFFEHLHIPGRQVKQGCFCCNYNDLDASISSLVNEHNPTVIFAEAVGSCTDMVATVVKPLLQLRPSIVMSYSTFADIRLLKMVLEESAKLDDAVVYIYQKQLEEAALVVINKIDLVSADELVYVKALMNKKYPGKKLLFQNSFDQLAVQQWLYQRECFSTAELTSLQVDYDTYADGEAMLAWFDESLEIHSSLFNANDCAAAIINRICQTIQQQDIPIGHIKFLLNNSIKISFTNAMQPPIVIEPYPSSVAQLLINIRVQCSPDVIEHLVNTAVANVQANMDCTVIANNTASFQPGYPRPLYRI